MKLIHGDCLIEMQKLIEEGIVVDSIICDLPYGQTSCSWDLVIPFNKHIIVTKGKKQIPMYENEWIMREAETTYKSINLCRDEFRDKCVDGMWDKLNKLIKPNGAIVLFGSEPFSSALRMSNIKNYKYDWYWRKNKKTNFANSKRQPLRDTETISVFCKRQSVYNPQGITKIDKKVTRNKPKNETINAGENNGSLCGEYIQEFTGYPSHSIEFKSQTKTVHQTQKPVALMEYLIKTYSQKDEIILDFTSGSGSTLIAAQNTGRRYIGIEIDKNYYEISKKRLEENAIKIGLNTPKEYNDNV